MAFELGARKEELEQQIALITSQWEANLQVQLQPLFAELQSVREETERLSPSQRPVRVQGAGAGSSLLAKYPPYHRRLCACKPQPSRWSNLYLRKQIE